jgi:glutamate/tyrosine decarboxylase-like PLP-dependent enzyme
MEKAVCARIEKGQKLAGIILNGGTTNEIIVDPIEKVVELREKIIKKYKLNYVPHLHIDSVIGWAWLFFRYYDFKQNPFKMSAEEVRKIKSLSQKISAVRLADSFGADFHKTGFCPYISSIFMVKDKNSLYRLGGKTAPDIKTLCHGSYSPFEYSMELTRSSIGPVSAYVALETFGIEGFQRLIYNIMTNGEYIRHLLRENEQFEVINPETEGIATLFIAKPQGFHHSYAELIKLDEKKIAKVVDYNHQFYLYSLQALENREVEFKMTFSKSYKPFGCKNKTGALKIYQMSPTATKSEIKRYIKQLIALKQKFDKKHRLMKEDANKPVDFVYR